MDGTEIYIYITASTLPFFFLLSPFNNAIALVSLVAPHYKPAIKKNYFYKQNEIGNPAWCMRLVVPLPNVRMCVLVLCSTNTTTNNTQL